MSVPAERTGEAALAAEDEQPWLRLDKRMLLVHPVNEVVKLLPVIAVSWIVGSSSGNHYWGLIVVAALVAYGVLRWVTTTYRIGPVHVQLRRGVFQKKVLSVPRNGSGPSTSRPACCIDCSGWPCCGSAPDATADATRRSSNSTHSTSHSFRICEPRCCRVTGSTPTDPTRTAPPTGRVPRSATGPLPGCGTPRSPSPDLSRSARWWASSSSTAGGQHRAVARIRGGRRLRAAGRRTRPRSPRLPRLVGLFLAASVLACVRYLVVYGRMTVTDTGRTLHVSHGLLRTRQTTLDRQRLRGTTLKEPLLLRLAGGASLDAIMTGVSAEHRESSLLLPQSPRAEAMRVMATVLGDDRQAETPLALHGPAARRRRYTRALWPAVVAALAAAGVAVAGRDVPWPVWAGVVVLAVAGAGLARDRYRGLGHAVLPGWLVTRSGSLDRRRDSLAAEGIIGWTVRQTFFQRRAGVATVIAATPAGTGRYVVHDLPAEHAWALVDAVTPGAGGICAARPSGSSCRASSAA